MAKGNLFLGMARGKVGDVVFTRSYGEQISRARNRSPKNPQTPLQLLQRVVLKTASGAYSLLQEITDHSFQGSQEGTPNQSRFMRVNVELLRAKLAEEINSGDAASIMTSNKANFASKGSSLAEMNAYQVSEGTLSPLSVMWDGLSFALVAPLEANPTYQSLVDALGLQRGDQLTFLCLSTDDRDTPEAQSSRFNSFKYARVILDPSDGDMTQLFMDEDGYVNHPNERNEGNIYFGYSEAEVSKPSRVQFNIVGIRERAGYEHSVGAATVIVSRYDNNSWQRSTQILTVRPSDPSAAGHLNFDAETDYLGDAVISYMKSFTSSLYLNQAES